VRRAAAWLGVVGLLLAAPAAGQTIPRTGDGHPDFNGIWQALNTAVWNLEDHAASLGVPAGQSVVVGGAIPYLPAALAKRQANSANRLTEDPEAKCYMVGVPRITYMPYPFQIVQTPAHLTFMYEYVHTVRSVYVNGPHPKGPINWWMGDSRARWDGDTLVVDVVHFTDQTRFDRAGNFHSEALHVVERYSLLTPDLIQYEATIEDPSVYSRPWTIRMPLYRRKELNVQLLDYECYALKESAKDAGR
jgi:hypothetical protein